MTLPTRQRGNNNENLRTDKINYALNDKVKGNNSSRTELRKQFKEVMSKINEVQNSEKYEKEEEKYDASKDSLKSFFKKVGIDKLYDERDRIIYQLDVISDGKQYADLKQKSSKLDFDLRETETKISAIEESEKYKDIYSIKDSDELMSKYKESGLEELYKKKSKLKEELEKTDKKRNIQEKTFR